MTSNEELRKALANLLNAPSLNQDVLHAEDIRLIGEARRVLEISPVEKLMEAYQRAARANRDYIQARYGR